MARRPTGQRRQSGQTPSAPGGNGAAGSTRERIVAAFLDLLAEKSFESIGFADIAERAGVSLAEIRDEFTSKLEIYAAHVKGIDRRVLTGGDDDMAEESPRERLFDVLMRRLDVMAPHKEAVRSLLRSVSLISASSAPASLPERSSRSTTSSRRRSTCSSARATALLTAR